GPGGPYLACSLQVDLQQGGTLLSDRLQDGCAWRAVPVHTVHSRPLQQCTFGDERIELSSRDEGVVNAVALTWPRRSSGDRNRNEYLRMFLGEVRDDSSLAHRSRTRDHGETRWRHDWAGGVDRSENSAIRAAVWCLPKPRSRRLAAISSRSMTLLARTAPTRGKAFKTSMTLACAMTSSDSARSSTCARLRSPERRACLISARRRRASVAACRACWRCSSLKGGIVTARVLIWRPGSFLGTARATNARSAASRD